MTDKSIPYIMRTGLLCLLTFLSVSCMIKTHPIQDNIATPITAAITAAPKPNIENPVEPQNQVHGYYGTILAGLVDLQRTHKTGPIDGCSKVQEGIINSGGFLVFSCEKLIQKYPIDDHEKEFQHYHQALLEKGWVANKAKANPDKVKKVQLARSEADGCKTHLEMALWADRSINEPNLDRTHRDSFRQIMFMVRFYDEPCQRYYPAVQQLTQ